MTTASDPVSTTWSRVVNGAREGGSRATSRADHVVTVLALIVMLTTVALRTGEFAAPSPVLVAFALASWVPLWWRTFAPMSVLITVTALELASVAVVGSVDGLLDGVHPIAAVQPVPVATMVAMLTVAALRPTAVTWVAAFASSTVLALSTSLLLPWETHMAVSLMSANLVLLTTLAGTAIVATKSRRAEAERERSREVEGAVLRERIAMARELHDVLAHNLMLINAQAGVAEYLFDTEPEAARSALRDITGHARRAVEELGGTVRLLRDPGAAAGAERGPADVDPQRGVDSVATLVDAVSASGADVTLIMVGDQWELGELASLAVYRIVQEALTNAAKYAAGAPVEVLLRWEQHSLRVSVETQRPGTVRPVPPKSGGFGLFGMQERAEAVGGTLTAERTTGGGFLVVAALPSPTTHDNTDHGGRA